MKKKDVELLKGSIEKWLKIKQSVKALDTGTDNCSLCIEYYGKGCIGCPVKKHTGKVDCQETPYFKFSDHQRERHGIEYSRHRVADCKKCSRFSGEMLGFLVSLLPVKEIRKLL